MSGKRIALVLPSLFGGGAERVMINLARGFVAEGHQVDLILFKREGAYVDQVPEGVRVLDFGVRRNLVLSGWLTLKLARYINRERPDALLAESGVPNSIAILAGRLASHPTRIFISEHIAISEVIARPVTMGERLRGFFARRIYPSADGIVCVSNGVADDLAQVGALDRQGITVIHNPLVTPEITERAEESCDHPWLQGDGPPVLLGVGRLVDQKDFGNLLRALAVVREQRDARLIILGEGPQEAMLRGLAEELGVADVVDLPGFVDNPYAYMARSAALVMSSAWEGFGNVIVEAMACGTPVVSTDCPSGPSEILQDGRYGPMAPIRDPEALAEAILRCLEEPLPREDLLGRAEDFSIPRISRQYLDLLLAGD